MSKEIPIEEFLELSKETPLIDVRTPAEYEQAHIPGALNLPLFTNQEREHVGTVYKKQGKTHAVNVGLEYVGPKLTLFTKTALSLNSNKLLLHCWRGGMRSKSMAWLLETVGLECYTLKGGYKSYRAYIRGQLEHPYNLVLLGGYTGSGKTDLLKILENNGQQVLDLEGMANHKGSAFGAIGQLPQPTTEMFENILYQRISSMDLSKTIWTEDESHNIGKVFIPEPFWTQMRNSPVVIIEAPFGNRLERLMRDYGSFPAQLLAQSIKKIEKRLGYDKCKEALDACESGNLEKAASISLLYYDKAYQNQLDTRFGSNLASMPHIEFCTTNPKKTIEQLKRLATQYNNTNNE
ncbi:MAG: tRNA 2-selenouridine(34) synthase MnmH [Bacteroidales bacterium]|nr:tRNA 2-selenouridine(34) synthase MnmH [Bacteroidales bacterium]